MQALLVVDLQNDFCAGGSLAVPDADTIVPAVNRLVAGHPLVVQTQDWHPRGHVSFASSHPGKRPGDTVRTPYGVQELWPDHCVPGTWGAAFHPDLETTHTQLVLRTGWRTNMDAYSAFRDNDRRTPTGLHGYLQELAVTSLVVCGLATDFCVKWSALDARQLGYEVLLVRDAVRGLDLDGSLARAWAEMGAAGVRIVGAEVVLGVDAAW
jgi:nicotinamidase/pyrazinamidase